MVIVFWIFAALSGLVLLLSAAGIKAKPAVTPVDKFAAALGLAIRTALFVYAALHI